GVTVRPGVAASLSLTGLPSTLIAGVASDVTVTARDRYGNLATGYGGTVRLSSSDNLAVLPDPYTFTSGVHTFANGVTLHSAGIQTVTVTDTANPALTSSVSITVPVGINSFPVPSSPSLVDAITTGRDGSVWFTEDNRNQIGRFALDGSIR